MRQFALSLGESEFALDLTPACAELLPALYPNARPLSGLQGAEGTCRLSIQGDRNGYVVSPRSSEAEPRRVLDSPLWALLALEEKIEWRVIQDARRLLALHGSAVESARGGCLVLGNSGSGKSSVGFQLAELGLSCRCEEIALCDPATWQLVGYPQTLSVSEALIDEFAAEFEIRGQVHRLSQAVLRYQPPAAEPAAEPTPEVDRILLPRFERGLGASVALASPEEVVTEILGCAFPPNVDTETQVDRVIELLERVEVLRLTYGRAAACREALAEIFV